MERERSSAALAVLAIAGLVLAAAESSRAAAIWTNLNSGFWREGVNWSGGQAPNLGLGSTFITNAGTKVVTVDSATPGPNRFINSLTLSAPVGATNTLFLRDLGLTGPLVVSNSSFNIYRGGALALTNSSLLVTGRFLSFNVWMGDVTLDSGLLSAREEPLTTNVTVVTRLGRTNAATLTINGGLMEVSQLLIGESPGAQFGRSSGTARLRDGELRVTGELSIGESASCTGRVEVTGGQLTELNQQTNVMRVGDLGFGFLTISNARAALGNVSVARHDGAVGLVTLLGNGVMTCSDDLSIGRFGGGTGTVLVAGGQLILTNHPIWVGREGSGTLILSNGLVQAESLHVAIVPTNTAQGTLMLAGGTMLVTSNFCLGDTTLSTGSVAMTGGELLVTNAEAAAALTVAVGTLTVSGGSATADNLVLTNPAGHLVFSSGTLRARATQIANGVPFVVGDGVRPANLELLGGIHSFAQGLVISSNATLTGCGTIAGTITSFGTIATNCGSGATRPSITQPPQSVTVSNGGPASFSVMADGVPPLAYQWRHDGADLPGQTGTTLAFSAVQPGDAGSYTVVVGNISGSVTSAPAMLRVLVSPALINTTFSGATVSFSFLSTAGLSYIVEFKNEFAAPSWTTLKTVPGNGGVLGVDDPGPLPPHRFYRVRVE
jgi:T5SS/PEP-CTERM-associated repeat protein